ncbi:3-hydroxyacyl-CoA dehydrogenase NAD-binding domain-containing protein [Nocardia inohanensis]|uniref:3-hydroxyacyl-CoA dehydrogenase NAD-binding domain-containing protein n=1 Tax=Nocardia inohanensis TaxID=209246 RepID=UPI0008344E92|nr:3-hydroxyacyl-CoA dehydrogenase NAD-binding domain-containing protein [Nocardia inohanensis]
MSDNIFAWERDGDGIVLLTIDNPNGSANTFDEGFRASLKATVDRLEAERDEIAGAVITSAKKTFVAGANLDELKAIGPEDAGRLSAMLTDVKNDLRRLEKLGKPVVAAINGAAMGGGLELALACHHRIAADVPGNQIGLPEVQLGVLPGAGGVNRTVRMIGLQAALMGVLLQGTRFKPAKAKETGLIDEIVGSIEELVPAAKAWIKANPEGGVQPWDKKGFKIPGGSPSTPAFAANLPAFPANLRKQLKGQNMPAPRAILAAAVEGAQVDFDSAQLIETRYLVELLTGPVAKNMIQAFFFDLQTINNGGSRPKDVPKREIKKVGVIGAGMMGAGIAYVTAKAGIDVVLKDVSLEAAQRGKGYAEQLEAKALAKGRTTEAKSKALLDRIVPAADPADFAGVDFVIEAVFENPELKHKVFQEIQDIVTPDAVLGSNTSTLPITELATGVERQQDFIGIHFFSPVDKMMLVEIIKGDKTSDEALARTFDYVLAIKRTPIVVNDSRGFFTSRIFGSFIQEATLMLEEGIDPQTIEQAGLQAGYPAAPLQLLDELNFQTVNKIEKETAAAMRDAGLPVSAPLAASLRVLGAMLTEHDRSGKLGGAGFYEYADGKRAGLWPSLREIYGTATELAFPFQDLIDRFLFAQALETQRVLDEGVLESTADANIGSIFAIGYPAWTGGVHQFVAGYPGGREAFLARADYLAQHYGERYDAPASLRS